MGFGGVLFVHGLGASDARFGGTNEVGHVLTVAGMANEREG